MTRPRSASPARPMWIHRGLWAAQVGLALLFVWTGVTKLRVSIDWLAANGRLYAAHLPPIAVRLAGVAELIGAVGLIVPAAAGIRPRLSALAAVGLALVMLGAVAVHLAIDEPEAAPLPAGLALLCLTVAWGRLRWAPFEPAPTDPAPTDPAPTDPAPTDPAPMDPAGE